jgi:hypothetical protein
MSVLSILFENKPLEARCRSLPMDPKQQTTATAISLYQTANQQPAHQKIPITLTASN